MKKLLFILLFSGLVSGQEKIKTTNGKTVVLNADNTWKYDSDDTSDQTKLLQNDFRETNNYIVVGNSPVKTLQIFNGEDKLVPVKVSVLMEKTYGANINPENVNRMIELSKMHIMNKLKNKFSFVPREVNISYFKASDAYVALWTYTAKNSYGGDVAGNEMVFFLDDMKQPYELTELPKKKKK